MEDSKASGKEVSDKGEQNVVLLMDRKEKKRIRRIAMIGHKRIPSREGGLEIVVDELSCGLAARGYEVDAYNRAGHHVSGKEYTEQTRQRQEQKQEQEQKQNGYQGVRLITVPTFPNKSLNAIVYAFLATIRALFGRYDVIHYHAEGPCIMLWIPRLFGIRVVVTIHGLDWQRSKWGSFASGILKLGEKMAARYASEVIVLSRHVQEYFAREYGRMTHYIPNGVRRPKYRAPLLIREKYGLQGGDYILFVGRIVPEKGVHDLIRAFQKIDTDKKLVIVGGSSHSETYRAEITEMASGDSGIILTGFVQGEELEEWYANAAVFVLPSEIEGMSISLLEAMSYGSCCLVSDIEENLEVVGAYAESFRKGDAEDLRQKLVGLLMEEDRRNWYREYGREYICSRHSWEEMTERTLEVYQGKHSR